MAKYGPFDSEVNVSPQDLQMLRKQAATVASLEYRYGAPMVTGHDNIWDALQQMAANCEYGNAMYVALKVCDRVVSGDRLGRMVWRQVRRMFR